MITYPVNPETRFTKKAAGIVRRGELWPEANGMPLQQKQPGHVILQEFVPAPPAFNPATEKLDAGNWVDDELNESATFVRTVVALTQAELDAKADETSRQAKKVLVAQAIPTLRQWAVEADAVTVTSGNAVTVLQQTVDHLSVFFDRFADLLEAMYIDKP